MDELIERKPWPANDRLRWLRTLCDPWRGFNENTHAPFSATLEDNVRWIGATNGHGMTLLRAMPDETAPDFSGAGVIAGMFTGAQWRAVPKPAMDAWATRQIGPRCHVCGGLGFVSRPDMAGWTKQGGGPYHNLWTPCAATCWARNAIGTIDDAQVNKRVLLRFMATLAHDTIDVATAHQMIALRTPDWRVFVVGVHDVGVPDPFVWPASREEG